MSFWSDADPRPTPAMIGHRGAPQEVLENTAASYARAFDHFGLIIEADIRLTADRVPVCLHDPDLLRVAGRPERIAELPLADAGAIFPSLCTLDVLFDLNGTRPIVLDVKCPEPADVDILIGACEARGVLGQVLFTSKSPEMAGVLRARAPEAYIGAFFNAGVASPETALAIGARWVRLRPEDQTPAAVAALHDAGLGTIAISAPLSSYAARNDRDFFDEIRTLGIRALIVDEPGLPLQIYGSAGHPARD